MKTIRKKQTVLPWYKNPEKLFVLVLWLAAILLIKFIL